ncbi:hypothetical protein HGRIS_003422 [Hohenbuehelia grisea]
MSLVPKFWTRLVIFIDQDYPAPLKDQLEWSKNLPFEILCTKRVPDVVHPMEGRNIQACISDLAAHLSRCTNLFLIDIQYTSTLPSVITDLTADAASLQTLRLECREVDGRKSISTWSAELARFSCPSLSRLSLDGANFMSAFVSKTFDLQRITHFAVAHYCAAVRGTAFPTDILLDALSQMLQLTYLVIEDIDFSQIEASRSVALPLLQSLFLISLPKPMELLNCIETEHDVFCGIYLSDCHPPVTHGMDNMTIPITEFLHLVNINYSDSDVDIPSISLFGWDARRFRIERSDTVSDIVQTLGHDINGQYAMEALYGITIIDCPTLSIPVLRETIAIRSTLSQPIEDLLLGGDLPLSEEDIQFFYDHVPVFDWWPEGDRYPE